MVVAETKRLFMRELTPGDAESIYFLNLDPEVIQYTGDAAFASVEAAKQFLEGYDHYKNYGFGRWAVILKDSSEFLGWCGLKYSPQMDEHDIGFRFFKKHWNKGFATEAARACMDLGFRNFKLQVIVGRAMPENKASIKVLTKIGLTFWEERVTNDKLELVYRINKEDV